MLESINQKERKKLCELLVKYIIFLRNFSACTLFTFGKNIIHKMVKSVNANIRRVCINQPVACRNPE